MLLLNTLLLFFKMASRFVYLDELIMSTKLNSDG